MIGGRDQCRTSLLQAWTIHTVLTTRALVLGRNGTLLLTLGLLAPAVIVVRVPIVGTHGSIGPVTGDAVTGAAGAASAGQAHSTEPALVWALVWGRQEHQARVPCQSQPWDMGTGGREGRPERHAGQGGQRQGGAFPQEPRTCRLTPARAQFLDQKAAGSPCAAHDTVVVVGDPIIPAHGRLPGTAALWPEEHLWAPSARVHAAEAARGIEGASAGIWRAKRRRSGRRSQTEVTLHARGRAHHKGLRTS